MSLTLGGIEVIVNPPTRPVVIAAPPTPSAVPVLPMPGVPGQQGDKGEQGNPGVIVLNPGEEPDPAVVPPWTIVYERVEEQ